MTGLAITAVLYNLDDPFEVPAVSPGAARIRDAERAEPLAFGRWIGSGKTSRLVDEYGGRRASQHRGAVTVTGWGASRGLPLAAPACTAEGAPTGEASPGAAPVRVVPVDRRAALDGGPPVPRLWAQHPRPGDSVLMDTNELAQRLTSHPQFRWVDGMLAWIDETPDRPGALVRERAERVLVEDDGAPLVLVIDGIDSGCEALPAKARPGLDDPATAGCLLARLYRDCHRVTVRMENIDGVEVVAHHYDPQHKPEPHWTTTHRGDDLGHAVASALLACWEVAP